MYIMRQNVDIIDLCLTLTFDLYVGDGVSLVSYIHSFYHVKIY